MSPSDIGQPDIPLLLDQAEPHPGGSKKMPTADRSRGEVGRLPPPGGFAQKAGTIGSTTDVAANFAKFIGYCSCLEETVGAPETGS